MNIKKLLSNKKNILFLLIGLLILIVIIIIVRNSMVQVKKIRDYGEKIYTKTSDFESIEEFVIYMGCEYKKEKQSTEEGYNIDIYLKFKADLYDENGNSSEKFFNDFINTLADVLGYTNFRLIDEDREIYISVVCNQEYKMIVRKYINGEEDYFAKMDAKKSKDNYVSIQDTNMEINSTILVQLINGNWEQAKISFGTRVSTYDKYDIYFNEGIESRTISGKIHNIIFRKNYSKEVINNIKVGTSFKEIEEKLGKPAFGGIEDTYMGYRGKYIYIFFYEDHISVYRVEKEQDISSITSLLNQYKEDNNISRFLSETTNIWTDYSSNINTTSFKEIVYPLKGIKITYRLDGEKGIFFYNNYTGKVFDNYTIDDIKNQDIELPSNIYIIYDTDLVLEAENERYMKEAALYIPEDEENKEVIILINEIEKGTYTLSFYPIKGQIPKSEINEPIHQYLSVDNYTVVYSIKNKGIYLYDIANMKKTIIVEGNSSFELKSIKDNVLSYDDKTIRIK